MSLHPIFEEALRPFAPPQRANHKRLPTFWVGDDIKVQVDYDYTPAERAIYDVDSPVCGPGHEAEIEINEVWLSDHEIRDLLADSVIESLKEQAFARAAA